MATCGLCRFYLLDPYGYRTMIPYYPHPSIRLGLPPHYRDARNYHVECIGFLYRSTGQYDILRYPIAIATMREPYFERPPASFEKNRRIWLESSYARILYIAFDYRLPPIVCKMIAADFTQERAVQIVRDAWLRSENTRPASLSMTIEADMALWAQYMGFEGNRYIKSLSYSSKGGPEVKIFERQGGTPLNIFIAHNHLGVVNIIATTGETVPKIDQKANHWWTILSSPSGPFSFQGRFDASTSSRYIASFC